MFLTMLKCINNNTYSKKKEKLEEIERRTFVKLNAFIIRLIIQSSRSKIISKYLNLDVV